MARDGTLAYASRMDWTKKHCVPCEGGVPRIDRARAAELIGTLRGWELQGERLHRAFKFADFAAAMRFVNALAALAESEGHHPDFALHDWNRLDVTTWTHAIGGLSENDFILAGKIDALPGAAPG